MNSVLSKAILYVALLGTAIGSTLNEQQINLSLLVILFWFTIEIITGGILKIPGSVMSPYFYFVLATIPGSAYYLFRDFSVLIPLKQYVGVFVFWIVAWSIFRYQKYSSEKIFALYLRCAKWAACIGIFQQISYLLEIEVFYDLRWLLIGVGDIDISGSFLRAYSLFTEPSYFAAFLMPALYFSILRITGKSKIISMSFSLIFIASILCTFSTIGYIGFALCAISGSKINFRSSVTSIVIILILLSVASMSPTISSRVFSILDVLDFGLKGEENLSVFVNALNLNISRAMLLDNPIFGLGIGSYRVYSMGYLESFVVGDSNLISKVKDAPELFTLTDGGSMYLRLPAEIGIAGCLLFIYLMYRSSRKLNNVQDIHIAKAALLFIIVFALRSGQLVRFDFIFFCSLYSLIWIKNIIPLFAPAKNKIHE